jgi:hypothetical protein
MFYTEPVKLSDIKVGCTYPFYGAVTEIARIGSNEVRLCVGKQIRLTAFIPDANNYETVKQRAFDPGIFIATVTTLGPDGTVFADCQTMVFGRRQNTEIN